jgi:L-seryl-tRNA(Ser) seleniumtransferase
MNRALTDLPSVNEVLHKPEISELIDEHGHELIAYATRVVIDRFRHGILSGEKTFSTGDITSGIKAMVGSIVESGLRPVINATGVVLHTNLGRAPLGEDVVDEVSRVAEGYSNLEFDLEEARRGNRNSHLTDLLTFLTSAEDALIVNNNAAGIMLALNTLARGREVIISRGELIEIGGSFRIPEIIKASGVKMVEVGTTNKTHLSDYEAAINPRTASIFKAHNSNFAIIGFTENVSLKELAHLAHAHDLPLVYDLGSGLLRKFGCAVLQNEPDVQSAISAGADLVMFSCDKLLGGPQAGIVAGRADLISRLKKAPLMRAFRVGKLTLAALSAVCRRCLDEEKLLLSSPTVALLQRGQSELTAIAAKLQQGLESRGVSAALTDSMGQCGGGTLPGVTLKSVAVQILPPGEKGKFAEKLFRKLLLLDRPIVGVLREGKILFDVLTVFDEDLEYISSSIAETVREIG